MGTVTSKLPVAGQSPSRIIPNLAAFRVLTSVFFAIVIFFMAFSLRAFRINESFDIFIDEITYLRLSQSVQEQAWPELYNEPFHLHPPAYFYFEAAYLNIVKPFHNVFAEVYASRYLNLVFASLTAVALFFIARAIKGNLWSLFVVMLFSMDAFIIRMNSRNLLDTAVLWWVAAGYCVLITGLRDEETKLARWRLLVVGICFGLSILTKDMAAFLTILPLLGMFVTGWFLPRLNSFFLMLISSLIYAIYPIATVFMGEWQYFYDQKLSGFTRFLGVHKATGLNRHNGPSLIDTLLAKIVEFGFTYALIGLGALAILILLFWGKRRERIIAAWGAGAYGLLAYSILFGTLEEQFFYFLIVPCVLLTTLAIPLTFHLAARFDGLQKFFRYFVIGGIVLFVAGSVQEWVVRHFSPDNGYEMVYNYLQKNVQASGQVASTSETGQFIMGPYAGAPWGGWVHLSDLKAAAPEYLLVSYQQVAWDYGDEADDLLLWVEEHGVKVFEINARTNHFALFALDFIDSSQR